MYKERGTELDRSDGYLRELKFRNRILKGINVFYCLDNSRFMAEESVRTALVEKSSFDRFGNTNFFWMTSKEESALGL